MKRTPWAMDENKNVKWPPHLDVIVAVISQAITDATSPKYINVAKQKKNKFFRKKCISQLRLEAREWLTNPESTLKLYLDYLPNTEPDKFMDEIRNFLDTPRRKKITLFDYVMSEPPRKNDEE